MFSVLFYSIPFHFSKAVNIGQHLFKFTLKLMRKWKSLIDKLRIVPQVTFMYKELFLLD